MEWKSHRQPTTPYIDLPFGRAACRACATSPLDDDPLNRLKRQPIAIAAPTTVLLLLFPTNELPTPDRPTDRRPTADRPTGDPTEERKATNTPNEAKQSKATQSNERQTTTHKKRGGGQPSSHRQAKKATHTETGGGGRRRKKMEAMDSDKATSHHKNEDYCANG